MKAIFKCLKSKITQSIILIAGFSTLLIAQIEASKEYELKAVFIYNFTKYIQWADSDTSRTFEIAVIGDSNIINPLKIIAEKKIVNNRKIIITHFQNIDDLRSCHILFISALKLNQLDEILQKVEHENILTISDSKGFAQKGVAINFILVADKVKFEINSRAFERTGLQVSSQLQKLAIMVEEEKQSND